MKRKRKHLILFVTGALLLMIFSGGCATTPTHSATWQDPTERFEVSVNRLIENLIATEKHSPGEMAPAAIMPGSLKTGTKFTRLEELIMERLSLRLREKHNMYSLSRQNWFEFREGRPLTFQNLPFAERDHMRNLVVYEVRISADEVLKKMKVHSIASDADGRAVPGLVADTVLEFERESPARKLYNSKPQTNPFPEGLEERPYVSLDRLAFSLAAELTDAHRTGISAGGAKAADTEVRVLLYAKPSGGIASGLVNPIQNSLQQAIVGNRGFACAVSREDFGPAFKQIDFYKKHKSIFEMEESKFTAGTVLLMADVSKHPDGDKIGVALRAIWRVTPLETAAGDLIPTNVAGTYLSGFTAKAYLSRSAVKIAYGPGKVTKTIPATEQEKAEPPKVEPIWTGPPRDMDVCFYKFTEVYRKRIYSTLNKAPGVTDVRRVDALCQGQKECLCYELTYHGSSEKLSAWLDENLRTARAREFKIVHKGEGLLELHFTGGFD